MPLRGMAVGMAEKPWVSSLSYEVTFPVRGKVLHAIMCDCEEEGDIRSIERAVGRRLPRVTVPDFDYKAQGEALPRPVAHRQVGAGYGNARPPRRPFRGRGR